MPAWRLAKLEQLVSVPVIWPKIASCERHWRINEVAKTMIGHAFLLDSTLVRSLLGNGHPGSCTGVRALWNKNRDSMSCLGET